MLTTLQRLSRLSRKDFLLAAEAAAIAVPIEIALRRTRLDTLVERLGRAERVEQSGAVAFDVERAARLVDAIASFYPLKATCLKKSLVLFRILRRRGVQVELRLGVAKRDGEFMSHAWLEWQGRTLLGQGITDRYTPLPAITRIG
jgi:hypothetical protein